MTRSAIIRGIALGLGRRVPFEATIEIEDREDCYYYTWRAVATDGTFLRMKGHPVSKRVIPPDVDPFEYALQHAVENVRRTREHRMQVFEVQTWRWIDGAG